MYHVLPAIMPTSSHDLCNRILHACGNVFGMRHELRVDEGVHAMTDYMKDLTPYFQFPADNLCCHADMFDIILLRVYELAAVLSERE